MHGFQTDTDDAYKILLESMPTVVDDAVLEYGRSHASLSFVCDYCFVGLSLLGPFLCFPAFEPDFRSVSNGCFEWKHTTLLTRLRLVRCFNPHNEFHA